MISLKTIANRFLGNGVKPKITLSSGSVYAGYGMFNQDKGGYEIPLQVTHSNDKISFEKWDLDHSPIVIKHSSFSFIGTVHELETLCNTSNATLQHHQLHDEFRIQPKAKNNSIALAM
ncbi:hypothetical protein LMH73_017840 [Vibrio splendidus]|nr:hypothetical protein [Vibrio splendidus]MCC4881545.1 hypothetical protein [Vibrio splendidus]